MKKMVTLFAFLASFPAVSHAVELEDIVGRHGQKHSCEKSDEPGGKERCNEDYLHIAHKTGQEYQFTIFTVGEFGHSCGLEGTAVRVGNTLSYKNGTCQLDIIFGPSKITLLDDGSCHSEAGCGARVSLNRHEFRRAIQKKQ